jgi:hypothetical protein
MPNQPLSLRQAVPFYNYNAGSKLALILPNLQIAPVFWKLVDLEGFPIG